MAAATTDRKSVSTPAGRPGLPADDDRLVAAVRAGDERAFEQIYDRHAGALLSYCRHTLGSRHEAEDALQQTFLKAYKALRSSDSEIALRPWLYAIARNECFSALRRRDDTALSVDQVELSTEGLAVRVERREELRAMLADIASLPRDQREALILTGLDTLSGAEVAEVLECDRSRVKSLVFYARQSLATTREARDTSCTEIRRQLSVLRGRSLRNRMLKEHLLECDSCRAFRYEIRRQRQLIGSLLPVVPTVGLKDLCLPEAVSAALAAGASGTAAATGAAGLGSAQSGVGAATAAAGSAAASGSAGGIGLFALSGGGHETLVLKGALAVLGIAAAFVGGGKLVGGDADRPAGDRDDSTQVAAGGEPSAAGVAEWRGWMQAVDVRQTSEGGPTGERRAGRGGAGESAHKDRRRGGRGNSKPGGRKRGRGGRDAKGASKQVGRGKAASATKVEMAAAAGPPRGRGGPVQASGGEAPGASGGRASAGPPAGPSGPRSGAAAERGPKEKPAASPGRGATGRPAAPGSSANSKANARRSVGATAGLPSAPPGHARKAN